MILMLNCSYKGNSANTMFFFDLLKNELMARMDKQTHAFADKSTEKSLDESKDKSIEIVQIKKVLNGQIEDFVAKLQKADALVIGAPLYVDGLPAQAVKVLEILLEDYKGKFPELLVYVVSNLGFYEAKQIQNLLAIVENWCARMGMTYGGGLAVGCGPMVRALSNMPMKKGPLKDIGMGLETLAKNILARSTMGNYYTKTMIPRWVYLKAAHMTFGQTAKKNGLKVSDIK